MINRQSSLTQQSGAVLAIGLFMLLLLTLIGITGSQVTTLEEKMAGNSRDQNVAFQSAEGALRAGEADIANRWDGIPPNDGIGDGSIQQFCGVPAAIPGLFSSVAGCLNPAPADNTLAVAATWTNANSILYDDGSGVAVANQPRYFINYISAYNPLAATVVPISFMVTARGVGGQAGTQVILRSYYGGPTVFLP
ncbi:PilX N-terminal domain-containing pilus assembly protein [Methyloglobulus sp.]|uniref:pilus assembly PilX family protein n=1 Tax=Methyloglobulus sp. TaxID=2518622 RepID=UPI0039890B72